MERRLEQARPLSTFLFDKLAELFRQGNIHADMAWRATLAATLSNLALKAGVVAFLGGRKLFSQILVPFGLALAVGLLIVLEWPAAA